MYKSETLPSKTYNLRDYQKSYVGGKLKGKK